MVEGRARHQAKQGGSAGEIVGALISSLCLPLTHLIWKQEEGSLRGGIGRNQPPGIQRRAENGMRGEQAP